MKKNLGFGWMRLPQLSEDPTNIDFDQVKQMVDTFLDAGFNYFDTSFVYHNGHSENAIKKCLVERHPRDRYMLASKLPVFSIQKEEEVVQIFNQQLETVVLNILIISYYTMRIFIITIALLKAVKCLNICKNKKRR